eukprot:13420-Heterococcus_DN1.PRE.1
MLRCKSSSRGVVVESDRQWKLPAPTALSKAAASAAAAAALVDSSSGSDDDIMMRVSNSNKSNFTSSALTKLSAIATAKLALLEAPF